MGKGKGKETRYDGRGLVIPGPLVLLFLAFLHSRLLLYSLGRCFDALVTVPYPSYYSGCHSAACDPSWCQVLAPGCFPRAPPLVLLLEPSELLPVVPSGTFGPLRPFPCIPSCTGGTVGTIDSPTFAVSPGSKVSPWALSCARLHLK